MIKRVLFFVGLMIVMGGISAQDIHFSQFYASPLTLNPALTGKVECTYRVVANYRNQWNAVPAPYVTYSAAFDASLWEKKMNGSSFGIGFMAFNDRSGDGNLSQTNASLSLAYHAQLAEGHKLSLGFQGSYVSKRINDANLLFSTQIGPSGPIVGAPHGENLQNGFNYYDLNAGIHWSSVFSENFSFNIGGAYYHILQPNESFLGADTNNIQSRYVAHGSMSFTLGDDWSFSPSGLYMLQGNASQINTGGTFGYHMDDAALYFGSWFRIAGKTPDAIIPLVGIEFTNLKFGFSYDISISDVRKANGGKGGFELSIAYTGCVQTQKKVTHCPKF
jgi:type IX secretion system PorP/SprF family membrane protein